MTEGREPYIAKGEHPAMGMLNAAEQQLEAARVQIAALTDYAAKLKRELGHAVADKLDLTMALNDAYALSDQATQTESDSWEIEGLPIPLSVVNMPIVGASEATRYLTLSFKTDDEAQVWYKAIQHAREAARE